MGDQGGHERRKHFRGKGRPGRKLAIRFRCSGPTGGNWVDAETRNIGVGGAFIATEGSNAGAHVGSELEIELTIPTTDQRFRLPAIVQWQGNEAMEAGMGVKFVRVDIDVLLELNDFFASMSSAGE